MVFVCIFAALVVGLWVLPSGAPALAPAQAATPVAEEQPIDEYFSAAIFVAGLILGGGMVYLWQKVLASIAASQKEETIPDGHIAVIYKNGRRVRYFPSQAQPGMVAKYNEAEETCKLIDMREQIYEVSLTGLTADKIPVQLIIQVRAKIQDINVYLDTASDPIKVLTGETKAVVTREVVQHDYGKFQSSWKAMGGILEAELFAKLPKYGFQFVAAKITDCKLGLESLSKAEKLALEMRLLDETLPKINKRTLSWFEKTRGIKPANSGDGDDD
jgi:hypothetical protein